MTNIKLIYSGRLLENPVKLKRETIDPYLPDKELINAVNLSIVLQRPLLLMGEPGCGKSKLAQAVAYELYHDQPDYRNYYFEWHIKSSTKAREGFYDYDAIRRLGDAQVVKTDDDKAYLDDKKNYIKHGPMGQAIQKSNEKKRAVLLIDEIDKADLDFPNDLLNELDRGEYTIPELQKTVKANTKPIVIITSNREKDLPDAFLRRCIYHYIDPLGPDLLKKILRRRFYGKTEEEMRDSNEEKLIGRVVEKFLEIRRELNDKKLIVGKNISTSELIDWFAAINYYIRLLEEKRPELEKTEEEMDAELRGLVDLLREVESFETSIESIPFRQVLFKNHSTLLNFK